MCIRDSCDTIRHNLFSAVARLDYKRLISTMATGKLEGPPFEKNMIEAQRKMLKGLMELASKGQGRPKEFDMVPEEGQCFLLKPIGYLLRLMGDPDWRIYAEAKENFVTGVRIGYDKRMPRTPAVFERKTHWHHYTEDQESGIPQSRSNYTSAQDNVKAIERQFEEEAKEGFMRRVRKQQAEKEYGDSLLIAGLAAIEKSDESFRVIHDGTHGVKVNPKIKLRDQTRSPTIAEGRTVLGENMERGGTHFSLKGDVRSAHRRVKNRRKDHGRQACQLKPPYLWLNQVGTFGIGSAAYWLSLIHI